MNRPDLRPGQLTIAALVLLTVVAVLLGLRNEDLRDLAALLDYLGRASAIVGLLMLLLAAVLSARLPRLDRHFGGLTHLWQTHHRLGAGSLLLLMAHPLLLALAASAGSGGEAVAFLFPPLADWALWSGWAALVLMMLFLAPSFSFFGRPHYERWKHLHRLSGPAVLLALLHSAQYGRTLPGSLQTLLWWLLGVLALAALVWHFGLSRRFGRRRYVVERTMMVANNLVELVLAPVGRRRLRYRAGQFVYLTPYDETLSAGHGEEHPYTLSSSPLDEHLRVAIKDLGDASRAIQTIQLGSRVTVEGPYGDFFPRRDDDRSQLWIAGGIGITPFLARARHIARLGVPVDVHLIYCVQDEARARFLDELRDHAAALPGFELTAHLFYRMGPLDRDFLTEHCPDHATRAWFICGPTPLNRLARGMARSAGVARRDIHTEAFDLL
ncbi:MAG: ferredoxin reductase family protein [Wenzhouxiangellaceae bacterium]|nr:ferredoxin reductase family protein [Wenzhouxiangellaceae bacterium]